MEIRDGKIALELIRPYSYQMVKYARAFGEAIFATMIYAGVYTFLASLGFWTEGNIGLMPMVYNLSHYGRYPMTIYRDPVRFILTWILPFAFVGFYPATIIMHRTEFLSYALLTPVIG